MTVECSLLLPVFLFAVMSLFVFFSLMLRQETTRYRSGYSAILLSGASNTASEGGTEIIELQQIVSERTPFRYPVSRVVHASVYAKTRKWVGGKLGDGQGDTQGNNIVYKTALGEVYHTDSSCSYLHPTIRQIEKQSVYLERNIDGKIYYPCETCGGNGNSCYITNYGESYHSDLSCGGLKRTIYMVSKCDVEGWKLCSKCASHAR